jgi:hypothetical protein
VRRRDQALGYRQSGPPADIMMNIIGDRRLHDGGTSIQCRTRPIICFSFSSWSTWRLGAIWCFLLEARVPQALLGIEHDLGVAGGGVPAR